MRVEIILLRYYLIKNRCCYIHLVNGVFNKKIMSFEAIFQEIRYNSLQSSLSQERIGNKLLI